MLKPPCKRPLQKHRVAFQEALAEWFGRVGKDYPWRRTRDPYAILVAEIMLQQTRIATVLGRGFYVRFMERFPDLEALAGADDDAMLKAWEGLGYYRRVRMLRQTAGAVIAEYGGTFPREPARLMRLPGVGRYTAEALRAFAFDLPAAVVDGNVARVLARLLDFSGTVDDPTGLKRIWAVAEEMADPGRPRVYNSALMELGQTVCRPGVPDCIGCPVSGFCRTREPQLLPVKRRKIPISAVDEHALWIRNRAGEILMHREQGVRRNGLWKLPTREAAEISALPVLAEHCYTITRYRVSLRVHDGSKLAGDLQPADGESWIGEERVAGLAMPSPFRRTIAGLLGWP